VTFSGTVSRSGTHGGRTQARIVGGKGGLSQSVEARGFANVTARQLLTDSAHGILALVGEALASSAESASLSTSFSRWHRRQASAGEALTQLAASIGALSDRPQTLTPAWRTLADGTVWVGVDTYPAQELEYTLIDQAWNEGQILIAPDAPELRPGVTFLGQRIEQVTHRLTASGLRTEASLVSLTGALDRLFGHVNRRIDESRLYPATVARQNADGTLQVVPDDPALQGSGLDRVVVLQASPGHKLEWQDGARVYLGFAAGDPSRPFAIGWQQRDTGPATKTRIGQLLIGQNATSFALLPPQFFPAGAVGDAAAEVARLAMTAGGNTAFLLPIESNVWAEV
jgi:hypothetical protein